MQSFRRALSVFAVGGMLYCASELLYRRRTHPSMFAAGGLALLTADRVRRAAGAARSCASRSARARSRSSSCASACSSTAGAGRTSGTIPECL